MGESSYPSSDIPSGDDKEVVHPRISVISKIGRSKPIRISGASIDRVIEQPKYSLDHRRLRRLLNSHNNSTPATRVRDLLTYAWETPSQEGPDQVPAELVQYMPEDLNSWAVKNFKRAELITGSELRLSELNLRTDKFIDSSTFLGNALEIEKRSMGRREGKLVLTSARLMVNDAYEMMLSSK